jgi:hypothetical protein
MRRVFGKKVRSNPHLDLLQEIFQFKLPRLDTALAPPEMIQGEVPINLDGNNRVFRTETLRLLAFPDLELKASQDLTVDDQVSMLYNMPLSLMIGETSLEAVNTY